MTSHSCVFRELQTSKDSDLFILCSLFMVLELFKCRLQLHHFNVFLSCRDEMALRAVNARFCLCPLASMPSS